MENDMLIERCEFCQEFAGHQTWLTQVLGQFHLADRILIRANEVISLAALGPITPGYALVLPRAHHFSIGELPAHLLQEVEFQKQTIVNIIKRKFGSAICFEHGAITTVKRGGACLDHAHIHIIAGCPGFRNYVAKEFEEIPLVGLSDLVQFVEQGKPYLFIEDLDGLAYAYRVPDQIPSQYLRRVWARATQQPDKWDWAVFPNYELMQATIDVIRSELGKTP
jgi:diadenosine tetraphosphate (Ap4A) HIT family hydrolase